MSGITNYSAQQKPSVAFSGETTQFEDALLKHGVVTKEQVLLNQGMDADSVNTVLARDAVQEFDRIHGGEESRIDYQHESSTTTLNANGTKTTTTYNDDNSDSDDDDLDDGFMEQYVASDRSERE